MMLVSQAEYARQRGVSRQYVGQMVAKGIIGLSNRKVDTERADAALAALREPARPERRVKPDAPVQTPSAGPHRGIHADALGGKTIFRQSVLEFRELLVVRTEIVEASD